MCYFVDVCVCVTATVRKDRGYTEGVCKHTENFYFFYFYFFIFYLILLICINFYNELKIIYI